MSISSDASSEGALESEKATRRVLKGAVGCSEGSKRASVRGWELGWLHKKLTESKRQQRGPLWPLWYLWQFGGPQRQLGRQNRKTKESYKIADISDMHFITVPIIESS